jgi:predicted acyltransferase
MSDPNPAAATRNNRIISVDALRGFDMFCIIGGQQVLLAIVGLFVYPIPAWLKKQTEHVNWEGFTAWDMIMPLFLFIVGTAIPLSFARRVEAGQGKASLYRKILVRTAILFLLGIVAQGNLLAADLSKLHLYCNTLQAIACGYLIASIAVLHLRLSGQIALAAALLVGYWLLLCLVPFSGHAAGTLEEKANLALFIDETILGRFRDGTTYTWILSGMAFGATVLLGVFSGHLLRSALSPWRKAASLAAVGLACLALGWMWSQHWLGAWRCPIIKHIFSSSMVLWACGWSYLLLSVFFAAIDVLGFRRWTFLFVVIGSNAIFAYMAGAWLHSSFAQIANVFVGGTAHNLLAAQSELLQALGRALSPLATFAVIWSILWYLYRNKTFIRI